MPQREPYQIVLGGGLELVNTPLTLKPGRLIGCKNYEADRNGGYVRVGGYERFDGQPAPSTASYWFLPFDAGTTEFVAGDVVFGATSFAIGEVLSVSVASGDWATNDAAGDLVLFDVTGTFEDDEELQVDLVTQAVANGTATEWAEADDTAHHANIAAAREARRARIEKPTGSGSVRGGFVLNGVNYCFRDNAGATACGLWKQSAAGWTAVDLGDYIVFTAGTAAFTAGDTVTGGTSAASGTLAGVVIESGDWSTNDAAGRLYLTGISGTFQAETVTSAGGSATCSGAQVEQTLSVGGRYECIVENFGGSAGTRAVYGVDGVNRAFTFDGTTFLQIMTGMATDTPTHLIAHKRHLFLSFGTSVQFSPVGDPTGAWSAVTGAGEIATGDNVTGFDHEPGDEIAVFTRNRTYRLMGTPGVDLNLVLHDRESGALPYSIQSFNQSVYLDDRGIKNFATTQAFGDFDAATISKDIQPLILAQKLNVRASIRVKSKDQYRLFFSDNSGITGLVENKNKPEWTSFELLHTVFNAWSGEDASGGEVLFVGTDDGWVMQLDAGESFDGEAIDYYLQLPYAHFGYANREKDFQKAKFEMDAASEVPLEFWPDFNYGGSDVPPITTGNINTVVQSGGGAYFDTDALWGEFLWDAQPVPTAVAYLTGSGVNMSLLIRGESSYESVHRLKSIMLSYTLWGLEQ